MKKLIIISILLHIAFCFSAQSVFAQSESNEQSKTTKAETTTNTNASENNNESYVMDLFLNKNNDSYIKMHCSHNCLSCKQTACPMRKKFKQSSITAFNTDKKVSVEEAEEELQARRNIIF